MGLQIVKHSWYGTDYPGFVCENCGNQTALESNMSQFHLASFYLSSVEENGTMITCNKCQRRFVIEGSLKEACRQLMHDHRRREKARKDTPAHRDYIAQQRQSSRFPLLFAAVLILLIVITAGIIILYMD